MDIRALVESSFNQHEEQEVLIREVLQFLLEEKMPSSESFDWSMIPEIPVSEIGWSDVRTEGGAAVAGPQRKLLEDYLNNIVPTGTLQDKLTALATFMKDGYKTISADSATPAATVKNVMSYLVFYKTLTRVITNFNASSAGFSFESFLATLLGGTQIAAGGGTIADFVTGDGNHISLKLYAEKSVEVGGSFADLVDDLTSPEMQHKMDYLVVLKNLKGKDLDQSGTLKFYEFGFNLDNVANIIAASAIHSKACMILPLVPDEGDPTGYRLALPEDTESIPGRTKVTDEELDAAYEERARLALGDVEQVGDISGFVDDVMAHSAFRVSSDDSLLRSGSRAVQNELYNLYGDNPEIIDILNVKVKPAGNGNRRSMAAHIAALMVGSFKGAIQALKKDPEASRKATVARLVPALQEGDLDRSVAWYNAQTDPKVKMQALRVSNGYLNNLKFAMGKTLSTSPQDPTNSREVGELFIGAEFIAPMIEGVRGILNDEVFSIFSSLKALSTNLNEFFATGLQDSKKAEVAITSADNIEKKTAKSVEKFAPEK